MPRDLTVEHPAMPVGPIHHGRYAEFEFTGITHSSVLSTTYTETHIA
jgi:hypothetical protein